MLLRQLPWAGILFSAVAATFLFVLLTFVRIEEPWNIVVVSQALGLARGTFIVALAHAVILGLPLYLLLRRQRRVGLASCAAGGFLVGSTPFAVLVLISMFGTQSASSGGTATIVNGVPTLAGWIEYAQSVGYIGLFGLAGGSAFWFALRASRQLRNEADGERRTMAPVRAQARGIASAATILTATILLLPSVVKDDSCHNLFRDGRTSIGPQIYADMKLTADDWSVLAQIFTDFGIAHSLSVRSDSQIRGGEVLWRELNLCNEAGVTIDLIDEPWLTRINSPVRGQVTKLSVYEVKTNSGWKLVASDLLNKIDMTLPGRLTFSGPDGKSISMQDALQGRQ